MEHGTEVFKTDAQAIRTASDEQEAKYKRTNKAFKNKIDDVNKKIADLIERKNGTAHTSRPVQPSASAPSSRSSSPRYYQAEWLCPKTLHFDESELEDIDRT